MTHEARSIAYGRELIASEKQLPSTGNAGERGPREMTPCGSKRPLSEEEMAPDFCRKCGKEGDAGH